MDHLLALCNGNKIEKGQRSKKSRKKREREYNSYAIEKKAGQSCQGDKGGQHQRHLHDPEYIYTGGQAEKLKRVKVKCVGAGVGKGKRVNSSVISSGENTLVICYGYMLWLYVRRIMADPDNARLHSRWSSLMLRSSSRLTSLLLYVHSISSHCRLIMFVGLI